MSILYEEANMAKGIMKQFFILLGRRRDRGRKKINMDDGQKAKILLRRVNHTLSVLFLAEKRPIIQWCKRSLSVLIYSDVDLLLFIYNMAIYGLFD